MTGECDGCGAEDVLLLIRDEFLCSRCASDEPDEGEEYDSDEWDDVVDLIDEDEDG